MKIILICLPTKGADRFESKIHINDFCQGMILIQVNMVFDNVITIIIFSDNTKIL